MNLHQRGGRDSFNEIPYRSVASTFRYEIITFEGVYIYIHNQIYIYTLYYKEVYVILLNKCYESE